MPSAAFTFSAAPAQRDIWLLCSVGVAMFSVQFSPLLCSAQQVFLFGLKVCLTVRAQDTQLWSHRPTSQAVAAAVAAVAVFVAAAKTRQQQQLLQQLRTTTTTTTTLQFASMFVQATFACKSAKFALTRSSSTTTGSSSSSRHRHRRRRRDAFAYSCNLGESAME